MARLGVDIESIAELRNNMDADDPDPVSAAIFAEIGGADGIVCPIREELKPISERDIRLLREMVKTHLTLQIPPAENMINLALSITPDMVTITPGKKPGSTQGGGLDVLGHEQEIERIVSDIRSQDIIVSLQVEPVIHQVKSAAKVGADYVELHLGSYAKAEDLNERMDLLDSISSVALAASKMGVGVAAGQGLNYTNVIDIASIESIEEINIGHAIVTRALWVGMETAVRDMVALVH